MSSVLCFIVVMFCKVLVLCSLRYLGVILVWLSMCCVVERMVFVLCFLVVNIVLFVLRVWFRVVVLVCEVWLR